MLLEKEIKQKSFKSPQHKLSVNLIFTCNWMNYQQQQFFKEYSITSQQYNVLRILRGQHPNVCSLKTIKERMLDRMSDASRITDKLVEKKLIIRNQCPDDRRSVSLLISEKGLSLLKEMDKIETEATLLFQNLSLKEIDQLNILLDKLRG